MFEIGEFVVHGSNGVCVVEDIGTLDVPGLPADRMYYTLRPHQGRGGKIFTPVENRKVIMRKIINKEEALKLIDDMVNIDSLWVLDEKKREQAYKEAFQKCDCREMVKIIKTIYTHTEERLAEGKKVSNCDERYFKMAEDRFYGELAIPLEMEADEVKEFVTERVESIARSI